MRPNIAGRFINLLAYTGLWIPLPATIVLITLIKQLNQRFEITVSFILGIFLCMHCISIYIWTQNSIAKKNGKQNFSFTQSSFSMHPEYQNSYRNAALERKPPAELLQKTPSGFVLGKSNGKYVCIQPGKQGATHLLVVGGSGSGKTSSALGCSMLGSNLTWIMVDIKGELHEKFFKKDSDIAIFNPKRRDLSGFDFFYDLTNESSDMDVLDTLKRVVYALIPAKNNNTDSFWTDGPRNILLGIFLYGWKHQSLHNLPDLADYALSKNLKTLINDILSNVESYSTISKLLTPFGGEDAADETLSSLAMNIGNALQLIATDETVRFLLRESNRKINPTIIEKGCSIDIHISDKDLNKYTQLLNLLIGCCCNYLTTRPEQSSPVVLCIDELGRLVHDGQIEGLQETLQIGRSRGVSVICCLQSWSAMEAVYPKGATQDMLNNFSYRLILQSQPDDKNTSDMAIKSFGKYTEKKRSVSKGKQSSCTYSYEEKDVLRETDLLTLPVNNKAIMLSPYGAYYLDKCQYFKDAYFKKQSKQILQKGEN